MKYFSLVVLATFPICAADIQAEIEAEIESRKAWVTNNTKGIVNKCCYGDQESCDQTCTQDWCATSHYHCSYCSRHNAVKVGSVDALARLLPCGRKTVEDEDEQETVEDEDEQETVSTGPSAGPVDTTLITGDGRPYEGEWPEGHSPRCCWGGCDGSCEHTYLFCSQSGSVCRDCAADEDGRQPEYHMCPGGTEMTKEQFETAQGMIPSGQEFRCCWKSSISDTSASCDNCDSAWCSDTYDQCSECAGEMKLCIDTDTSPTLAPGDAIPTGVAVPDGKSWQCCWGAKCGEASCNAIDNWCSQTTDQCSSCSGVMTLCDIPSVTKLADDATKYTESPAGTEWTCCKDDICGDCYGPKTWCSESNSNCQACNAHMFACPSSRRLAD